MFDALPNRSRDELNAALPMVVDAPKDEGQVALIVVRPESGLREMPTTIHISRARGVEGDRWADGSWLQDDNGRPHPDVQINLMNTHAAEAIAGEKSNWAAAGNNFFVNLDMSPENLPPGTRLALGDAEIEISKQPNKACQKFIDRYGRDACVFVNVGPGWALRMRGLYARVVSDGDVCLGDQIRKL